jgi:glycerol-3-phosphate dehydrogenase
VTDHEGAVECIEENLILRKIMLDALELNDGLFVALDDSDMAFKETFPANCEECHIPARDISVKRALEIEPYLNPKLLGAVQVPEGVFDPYRFCLSFFGHSQEERRDRVALS